MNILVKHSRQTKARKTNIVFHAAIDLFLILMILFISGCAPQVSTPNPLDSQSTQVVNPTDSATPIPSTANDPLVSPTPSPSPTLTSTPLPSTSLRFVPDADAYVKEAESTTNFGAKSTLQVDGGEQADESFIRFTVENVSGTILSAHLRLYTRKNSTKDGPAIYATSESWDEEKLTWSQRPDYHRDALDNKDQLDAESWVEYDVTSAVTGNTTFNFVLVGDSKDAVAFSSRESNQPPELVVTFIPEATMDLPPTPTSFAGDVTLVGAGDISTCKDDNDELTAQLLDNIPGTVFTVGDNAYDDGEYRQFTECFDPTWGRFKDRMYPIPGNHDYDTTDATGYFQYFNNIPSYYAYDLGSWRIYALNSEINVTEDGPQVKWLQSDLATHTNKCVLAYWHEPRWSSGSTHGNSLSKQTLWKTLYEAGAELVLNGHEHIYERFMPMNSEGQGDPLGLREIIIGTGGAVHYPLGTPLSTSEVRNNNTYGVLKLTLHSNSYDWEFIPVAGSTFTDSGSTECH